MIERASREQRLRELFDAHANTVRAYAGHFVDPELAKDVVAETYLTAWRKLGSVPADALPWLLAVARRVAANRRRGERRWTALTIRLRQAAVGSADPESDAVETRLDVLAALRALPPRDQEVLALVTWYDLSTAEAAEVLGCSHTALKIRLHRARRRLSGALEQWSEPSRPSALSHEEGAPR